jgi:hypothetical protein
MPEKTGKPPFWVTVKRCEQKGAKGTKAREGRPGQGGIANAADTRAESVVGAA